MPLSSTTIPFLQHQVIAPHSKPLLFPIQYEKQCMSQQGAHKPWQNGGKGFVLVDCKEQVWLQAKFKSSDLVTSTLTS